MEQTTTKLIFRFIPVFILTLVTHVAWSQGDFQVSAGSNPTGCGPLVVDFEPIPDPGKTVVAGNPYIWDLGNGSNSILDEPSAIYINNGTYDVSLIISYTDGTSETITKNDFITVFEGPLPSFSSNIRGGCLPLTVEFYNLTTVGDAAVDPSRVVWELGSGGVGFGDTVTYTFTTPGTKNISLFVEDDNGCRNAVTIPNYITVIDQLDADFTPGEQISCANNYTVTFNQNTTTTASGPFLYEWDFDSDGIIDDTGETPSHTFNLTGDSSIYDVTLTVTDIPSGCSDTEVKTGLIKLYDYQQDFGVSQTESCSPMTVIFTDNSNISFPFQTIEWDFDGDGVYDATGSTAIHTYTNLGNATDVYNVSMRVTGGDGTCGGVITRNNFITVHPEIRADIIADRTLFCAPNFTVDFDGSNSNNATIYRWDFDGNGTVDATGIDPPPFTYSAHGTYTARLEVENALGCTNVETIVVRSEPITPLFTANAIEDCNNLTTTFTNLTTSLVPVTNWDWTIRDQGGTVVANSTAQNPTITVNGAGIYSVTLTASNAECSNSVTQNNLLRVGVPPTNLAFTPSQFIVCNNFPIDFTNNSTLDPTNPFPVEFIWDFDYDGVTLDADQITNNLAAVPTHTYVNRPPGPVTVAIGYRSNGCEFILPGQVATQVIDIQAPVALFNETTDACFPDTLRLFNQSIGDDVRTWRITDHLGNLTTTTDNDPVLVFVPGTNVDVELEVYNNATMCTDIEQRVITMPPALPFFNTSVSDTAICVDNAITFNTGINGAADYTWYIGDTIRNERSPTVLFTTPGAYDTRLEVDFGNGCIKDTTITALIDILGPEVRIQANTPLAGCAPLLVELEDVSVSNSAIVNRAWTIGNDTISTTTNFSYVFDSVLIPQTLTYPVVLTVETADGCISSRFVEVNPTGPQPDFLIDSVRTCDEIIVNFEAIEVDSTGVGPLTFNWFTDAPGVTLGSGVNVSDIFPDGTWNVSLEVIDANACRDTITKSIDVLFGPALQAGFSAVPTTFACPPAAIAFTDETVTAPTVNVVSWLWDFGDGTSSTLPNPGKIYTAPSDYDVRLTVTDNIGCTSTILIEDIIKVKGPDGTFIIEDQIGIVDRRGYAPFPVEYTGTSDSVANQYSWDTGDGTIIGYAAVGDSTATYTYPNPGTYTPKMILRDPFGCEYGPPPTQTVTVLACPTVAIANQNFCESDGDQVISAFNNSHNITLGTMHYRWYLNGSAVPFASDVDQVTLTAPVGILTDQVDNYTVEIWVEDGPDVVCASSDNFTVTYSPNPTADFSFAGDQVCLTPAGVTVAFTNLSSITGGASITRLEYDFDFDGTNFNVDATVNNPVLNQVTNHTYTTAGNFLVAMRVFSSNGCDDQAETPVPVVIHPLPEPDFNRNGRCDGDAITLNDNSSIQSGTIDFYEWDLDNDGIFEESGAALSSLSHTFPGPGRFPVTLKLTSDQNCEEQTTEDVVVHPRPVADLSATTVTNVCFGNNINFDASNSSITGRTATVNGSNLGYNPSIRRYRWDFDNDGSVDQTTNGATVSYLYPAPGTYTASVEVESNRNCRSTTTISITIYSIPTATFSVSNTCLGQPITFDAASATAASLADGVTITNYEWDYNYTGAFTVDASGNQGAAESVQNTYNTPGNYTIALRVTSSDNCQAFYTSDISIPSITPDYTFLNVCDGATINFYDNSTYPDTLAITSFEWDFNNDGIVDRTGAQTDFQYNIADYPELAGLTANDSVVILEDAILTLVTADGCRYSIAKEIVVKDVVIPIPAFSISEVCEGLPTTLNANASSAGDTVYTITDYDWDLDNDGTFDSAGVVLNHIFPGPGTYPVTLRIITDIGCSMTLTQNVEIDRYPNADFNFTAGNICNGDVVDFTQNSTIGAGSSLVSHEWDFDNDGVFEANGTNVSYTFPGAGSFIVNYRTTTALGCDRIESKTIIINPNPVPSFSAGQVCLGSATIFTNNTTIENDVNGINIPGNTITSWLWDFNDGNTSNAANPAHVFANPGNYNVTLTAETDKGCSVTFSRNVRVNPLPVASFTAPAVCLSEATVFTDGSTIDLSGYVSAGAETHSIVSRTWDFGDGSAVVAGNQTAPSHTYANPGNYVVTLTVETDNGCTDTFQETIRVNPLPVASFTAPAVCLSEATVFTDGSTIDLSGYVSAGAETHSIVSRTWDFGDGSAVVAGNQTAPSHTYANPGNYVVTLTVETDNGCTDTFQETIRVNPLPVANFTAPAVCLSEATVFTDGSTIDLSGYVAAGGETHSIVSRTWDFGDGSAALTGNQTAPSHTYANPGNYMVTLTVETDNGCTDTFQETIRVNPLPVASFTAPAVCLSEATVFTDGSTIDLSGYVAAGGETHSIVSRTWDFGDGSAALTGNQTSPSHTYANPGNYVVTLTVETDNGCTDTFQETIRVNPLPVASFTAPAVCLTEATIFTDGSTIDLSGYVAAGGETHSIISRSWDFGDGSAALTGNQTSPSHTYANPGNYVVTLTVETDNGCTDTFQETIRVNPLPVASFTAPAVCLSEATVFTDGSTIDLSGYVAAGGETHSIVSRSWDFGDGSAVLAGNQTTPSHTYANPGNYVVTLTVETDNGCTDTFQETIRVNPLPVASFTAPAVCLTEATIFTDGSTIDLNGYVAAGGETHSIVSRSWDFGDGSAALAGNQTAPSHTYANPGNYVVTLTVETDNGCTDTFQETIRVNPLPVASFTAPAVCLSEATVFTDGSTIDLSGYVAAGGETHSIVSRTWDFGDGSAVVAGNQTAPSHTYANPGNYVVTLTVETDNGCTDTFQETIRVNPLPVANFTAPAVCLSEATVFTDGSTIDLSGYVAAGGETHSIVSRTWDFGDGSAALTGNQTTPSHTYANPGNYVATLTVETDNGCTDVFQETIRVNPLPVASFTAPAVCLSEATIFTDGSTIDLSGYVAAGGETHSIVSRTWDFGDGSAVLAGNQTTPSHTYANPGNYVVTLTVETDNGCTDVFQETIRVNPLPVASFTAPAVCLSEATIFTDGSTIDLSGYVAAGGETHSIVSRTWDFGDGSAVLAGNQTAPSHTYANPGNYVVTLTVETDNGCTDVFQETIRVNPLPVASFTAPAVCLSEATIFTDGSTIDLSGYVAAGGETHSIVSRSWDFGDGSAVLAGNQTAPSHTYANPGNYVVTLTVETDNGCTDTFQETIRVNPLPVASFTAPAVCLSEATIFTDGSTIDLSGYVAAGGETHSIVSRSWDFGDGSAVVAGNQTAPSHTYANPGNYVVTLTVETDNGCTDTFQETIRVNPLPVASFTAPAVCLSEAKIFTDGSTIDLSGYVAAGGETHSIVSRTWDFGDGSAVVAGNQTTPSHTYANPGNYVVTLTVETDNGCTDVFQETIRVNPLPVASFTAPAVCLSEVTVFTDGSTIDLSGYVAAGGETHSIVSRSWDFGDGSAALTGNQTAPSHTYANPGNYVVTLTVETDNGCTDVFLETIRVNPLPVASFTAPAVCLSEATIFTDGSTIDLSGYVAAEGETHSIVSRSWDFGDGSAVVAGNQTAPSHTYANPGNYVVTLTVETDNGCTDVFQETIRVNPLPVASFTAPAVCLSEVTVFTDGSTIDLSGYVAAVGETHSIVSRSWDFGDGSAALTGNQTAPSHTYANPGNYVVTLTVETDNGCTDTFQETIRVNPPPDADFSFESNCANESVVFNDLSTIQLDKDGNPIPGNSITSWSWSFGDGNTSNEQNPSYQYASAGDYNVVLEVTTNEGCTDQIENTVRVYPAPVANFEIIPACINTNLTINELSSSIDPFRSENQLTTWIWDFGNGDSSMVQTPDYAYSAAGTYTIALTVITENGCTNTFDQQVVIYPEPNASFIKEDVCIGEIATFMDNSVDQGRAMVSWLWDVNNDGNPDYSGPEINHQFQVSGKFPVHLTVTSITGCTNTFTNSITVFALPNASAGPDVWICEGEQTTLTASGGISFLWNGGETSQSISVAPLEDTSYEVMVTDERGCSAPATVTVHVIPTPPAEETIQACEGEIVVLDANVPGYDATYLWSNGDRVQRIAVTESGEYTSEAVVNFRGKECIFNKTFNVIFNPKPIPAFAVGSDSIYCFDNGPLLLDAGDGEAYIWEQLGTTSRTAEIPEEGIYKVTVTNEFGCSTSSSIKVLDKCPPQVYFPTAFTPNGDGLNDTFIVEGKHIINYRLEIYNRWGEVIFRTFDTKEGWEGIYLQEELPSGPFPYVASYGSEVEPNRTFTVKGSVTLIR